MMTHIAYGVMLIFIRFVFACLLGLFHVGIVMLCFMLALLCLSEIYSFAFCVLWFVF